MKCWRGEKSRKAHNSLYTSMVAVAVPVAVAVAVPVAVAVAVAVG